MSTGLYPPESDGYITVNDSNSNDKAMTMRLEFDQLATDRKIYEKTWDDLTEYLDPSQGAFVYREQKYDPQRKSYRRLDSTPVFAIRNLIARINAEMTGNSDRWFDFRDRDPKIDNIFEVRTCLQALSDKVYNMLNNGSFRTAHIENLLNWVVYGTACLECTIDENTNKPIFRAIPTREIYCAENDRNKIDLVDRKFNLTYKQCCEFFGDENIPEQVHQKGQTNPFVEIEILHRVGPNDDYKKGSKRNKHFKYTSTYMVLENSTILREGFFKRNPYLVCRFWKRPGEVYGGSCTIDVLPDIRILNLMREAALRIIQRKAEPPLIMAHDSVVLPVKITPNGVNYGGMTADGKRLIGELFEDRDNEQILMQMIQEQRQIIQQAFFVDPLMNRDKSIRTAAEVGSRKDEELIGLTQFTARLEIEYLFPLLEFALQWAVDNNKTIAIPKILHNHIPAIEFSGPLSKTQRSKELQGWGQFVQLLQPMAQIDQTIMQNIDFNKALYELIDLLSLPQEIVKDPKVVKQAQQQQQKAQQQQQMLQNLQGAAGSASDLANSGLLGRQDLGLNPLQQQGAPQQ